MAEKDVSREFLSSEPSGVAERPPQVKERSLEGKRIAVLVADGFEQTEFEVPVQRFRQAGATVEVLAPDAEHLEHIEGESHVKAFFEAKKPIAAICHGPWLLADAGVLEGKTVTSWPAIRKDLERAGASWVDQEVVMDGNLVFSRKPDDVEAFAKAFIGLLAGVTSK